MRSCRASCARCTRGRRSKCTRRRRSRRPARGAADPTARRARRARRRTAPHSAPSPPGRATRRAGSSRPASREQGLPRIVMRLLLQLLEQLALALLQPLRNGHLHPGEHVAAAGALQLLCALALDAEQRPVLGAALDLQRHRPVGRRRLNLGAERRLREGDRQLDDEVVAAALVHLRRRDACDDEEIARLAAVEAGLALALEADARAVLDAGRDLDRVTLRPLLAAGAVAARAGVLDHGAVSAASRARLRKREEALAFRDDAAALAFRADRRRGAGLGAGAVALRARRLQRDRDLRLHALERVLEREVDDGFEVVAAARLGPLGAARTAASAEDAAEQVAEIPEIPQVEVLEVDVAPAEAAASVRGAEGVVLLPLLGIREQVVRALNLLEPLLGGRVAGVAVRVVRARELAVGLLDLLGARVLRDAEDLVRVTGLRRHCGLLRPPRSPALGAQRGRRGGSPSASPRSPSPLRRPTAERAAPRGHGDRTCRSSRSRRGLHARALTRAGGARAARPPRASPLR